MTIAVSIDQLAQRLDAYQEQLTALSQALGGLREISDNLIIALQADRAAFAEHALAIQTAAASAAAEIEAGETELAYDEQAEAEADDAILEDVELTEPQQQEAEPLVAEAAAEDADDEMIETALDTGPETVAQTIGEDAPVETDAAQRITETLASVAEIAAARAPMALEADTPEEATAQAAVEPAAILDASASNQDQQAIAQDETAACPAAEIALETATEAQPVAVTAEQTEPAHTAAETTAGTAAAAAEAPASNVVDLAARRRKGLLGTPARRRFAAVAAMLVVTAGATFGFNELVHSELGQRLIELGTCDADMVSANRDCAFLSWLML